MPEERKPPGEEPRTVKNVTVTNCTLTTCCNGFKLGTSSEGGFENIVFSNSTVTNKPVALGERVISGVALEVIDGGWIDGVHVSGIRMERTRTPIFIRLGNRKRVHEYPQHGLRNVVIENVQASETVLASSITGIPGDDVDGVTLSNVSSESVLLWRPERAETSVPEKESAYPEARMFGMLPVSGLYVRHARNLRFNHVAITAARGESRPTLICDDVDGVHVDDLRSTPVSGDMPVVSLVNARNVTIANSVAPADTGIFVSVSGGNSANVVLAGDDLRGARRPFKAESGAGPETVTIAGNAPAAND